MRVALLAGLLCAIRAGDEKAVSESIYVEPSGLVHGVPGDSYATQCPTYKKDFPNDPEEQCGVVRRKCNDNFEFEEAPNADADEACKPIRWASWSPHSEWFCRDGTETRCQTRTCACHESDKCYDYFKTASNTRRPHDFTNVKCDPGKVKSGRICHDFNERDKQLTKSSQKRCETRPFVCHCQAEKNSVCPHCTSWARTPAGAVAEAKCGCGYKGSMTRKCVMSPDRCSCKWAQPSASCRKIKWEGWTDWDKTCPQQCEPKAGRVPKKIYRERQQLCNEDISECEAAAKLGCIGPRGREQELCKNYKKCECVEATKLFKDPIAVGQRIGDGGAGGGGQAYTAPEPQQVDQKGETGPAKKTAAKKGGRRSRRKAESLRKGKGASIFNNLLEGVQNIFKGRKRRRRKRNKKRGTQ